MPSIARRGALSARAFGFSGKLIKSQTFTANGIWIAPSGITSVNVSGQGLPGTSDYTRLTTVALRYAAPTEESLVSPSPPFLDWGTMYNEALAIFNALAVGAYGPNISEWGRRWNVDSSNRFKVEPATPRDLTNRWITQKYLGGVYLSSTLNSVTVSPPAPTPNITSGNVLHSNLITRLNGGDTNNGGSYSPNFAIGWAVQALAIEPGFVGAAASGLGQTFSGGTLSGMYPGATGNQAVVTSFKDISVVPGNSYPITVPEGGNAFVTVSYFV